MSNFKREFIQDFLADYPDIEDAYMFLDDVDAPHDKAKRYFLAMHD